MRGTVSGSLVLGGLAVVLALGTFVVFIVRAVRSEGQERDWAPGRATVLDTRPWTHSEAPAPNGSYVVMARLVTADGRQVDGWAEGAYARADRWVGSTRPAWHDPADPRRFRLTEPRGALIGLLRLLPLVLVLLAVLAVFVGVGALALR